LNGNPTPLPRTWWGGDARVGEVNEVGDAGLCAPVLGSTAVDVEFVRPQGGGHSEV
jgi:hypothetical protein